MTDHTIPTILERRLRSPECRAGRTDCTDPLCLCACHEHHNNDELLRRTVSVLDRTFWRAAGAA